MNGRRRPAASGGYTLVILMVACAVTGILLTASLPLWKTVVQREKEQELLFRGMQYAEAIRIYQIRFGALPTDLKQLIERKPRSIRQLWPDPMTEDGEWVPVRATPGQQRGRNQPGRPGGSRRARPQRPDPEAPVGDPRRGSGLTGGQEVGPIQGVRSKSEDESLAVFFGNTTYDTWEFTVELIPAPQTRPETGVLTRARSDWAIKGFPEHLQELVDGARDPRQLDPRQNPGVRGPFTDTGQPLQQQRSGSRGSRSRGSSSRR